MQPDRAVVVGSIQKLSRPENLARIAAERFDYVVVDEVHHADAPTYRRLLDRLDPPFLLGLTATPDRADQGDILGLFDDFGAYRADLEYGGMRILEVPSVSARELRALLVPLALPQNPTMSPRNEFAAVSRQMQPAFLMGHCTNVRGLCLFGY
jgi:hypothetical protein